MITTLVFDFSKVLLFAKDKNYKNDLNPLHKELLAQDPSYDFLSYFELNQRILEFLKTLGNKFELYIFTSGSIQNAQEIQKDIKDVFKQIISAEEISVSKKEKSGYETLLRMINKKSNEVLFIDDSETNLEAAKEAGINIFKYENNEELVDKINLL